MQGIIYRIEKPLETLQIDVPLEGNYLLGSVHGSTMTNKRNNPKDPFFVRFFSGSDRSVVFCFCPTESLTEGALKYGWARACEFAEKGSIPEKKACFVWSDSSSPNVIGDISRFIRESGTLTEASYSIVAQVKAAVDARGMAILAATLKPERIDRALTAYMLGLAYRHVLEEAINELAECCRDDAKVKRTETMHSEISRFIASYYFDAPARVTTTEVAPLYDTVHKRLRLKSLRDELVDQLGRIAEVIRIERTASESAFETRLQRRLTIFGAVIAFLGLVQVTQVTPAQVDTFTTSWKTKFSGNPATPALAADLKTPVVAPALSDDRAEAPPRKLKRVRHEVQSESH
ncbi:hypothetical protein [Paraburkholderia antibiotica]|uniref:Uncharacterized protein n=1 Tax=Paraburkholderia antibiotica TaxID=2728839 RepID=A0A7X9X0T5_9BURK|nr:hypothetical protein [Paraburkholderia antibiotica]NML29345.1 hypothetical protein [Paraburkholderia antibiotica]